MVSKEEHQIVKWKPSVTGEHDYFTNALNENAIIKSTIEQISGVLKLAMLKVGLREKNLPAKEEKQVLIDHILSHYGNHTPAEIKLAFDLAVAGKLEDRNARGEPIDLEVNCYENFSCLYFSKVMNAYRRWARDTYSQLKKDEPKMLTESTELSPIEMLDWINEWKGKTDIIVDLIPLSFYKFLTETDSIEVTPQMKWDYWEKALQVVHTELHQAIPLCKTTDALKELTNFEKMKSEGLFTVKMKSRIENKAKKLILFDYFRKK